MAKAKLLHGKSTVSIYTTNLNVIGKKCDSLK